MEERLKSPREARLVQIMVWSLVAANVGWFAEEVAAWWLSGRAAYTLWAAAVALPAVFWVAYQLGQDIRAGRGMQPTPSVRRDDSLSAND